MSIFSTINSPSSLTKIPNTKYSYKNIYIYQLNNKYCRNIIIKMDLNSFSLYSNQIGK